MHSMERIALKADEVFNELYDLEDIIKGNNLDMHMEARRVAVQRLRASYRYLGKFRDDIEWQGMTACIDESSRVFNIKDPSIYYRVDMLLMSPREDYSYIYPIGENDTHKLEIWLRQTGEDTYKAWRVTLAK